MGGEGVREGEEEEEGKGAIRRWRWAMRGKPRRLLWIEDFGVGGVNSESRVGRGVRKY